MEQCDKEATAFSRGLFTYLWGLNDFVPDPALPVSEMFNFLAGVKNAINILSKSSSFNASMYKYFKQHDMTRRNVFTFLAKYCFDNHAKNEDIFCVVLNICLFICLLAQFCHFRGHSEYLEFAPMCWTEIFKADLKDDFYANGGWEQFRNYVKNYCYVPKKNRSPFTTKEKPSHRTTKDKQPHHTTKDTDHKPFINTFDKNDYSSSKPEIPEPEPRIIITISTRGPICKHHKNHFSEQIGSPSPVKLNSADHCQNDNYGDDTSLFTVGENSGEENESEGEEQFGTQQNSTSEESSEDESQTDDSDEELYHELVRNSLNALRKVDGSPTSEDCVVCQNKDIRTVPQKDTVCLKHNPGSFYYLVAHSETEELDEEN